MELERSRHHIRHRRHHHQVKTTVFPCTLWWLDRQLDTKQFTPWVPDFYERYTTEHCVSIMSSLHCLSPAGLMLWVIFYLSLEKTGHTKALPNSTTKYTSMWNYLLTAKNILVFNSSSILLFFLFTHSFDWTFTHITHKLKQIKCCCWWRHSDVTLVDCPICAARCFPVCPHFHTSYVVLLKRVQLFSKLRKDCILFEVLIFCSTNLEKGIQYMCVQSTLRLNVTDQLNYKQKAGNSTLFLILFH